MNKIVKINDIGIYDTLDDLWAAYPDGGKEGDFCTIGGKEYYWDIYRQRWILSEQETIISDARKTEEIDGNLIVYHNLTVGGKIRAKDVKSLNCGLFMSLEALKAAYPTPEVGMWAVVGDTMPGNLYRCDVAGEWSATGGTGGVEVLDFERYEEFEQRIDKRVTTNSNDISDLKTKVSINKSDISDLKRNVASNTSEIGTINSKFAAIEQDVQNNQSSILRLDNEKATKQELQNTAQGLGQSISSVGALAGSNNTKINALQESVATNTSDISELKEGKANYTDIVDGTIVAAHALLADNAASAENAKNAEFATEAGKAKMSDTSTLATAAQTAYNVKATNIEGVLSKDQLPAYPTAETMEITDHINSTVWQDVINGNSVGEAISKLDSNTRIVQDRVDEFSSIALDAQGKATEAKQTSEEAKQIALGANRSITFATYNEMIHTLEGGSSVFEFMYGAKAKVGQNIYIAALNVPDCWIAEVDEQGRLTSSEYDTESPTFDNDIASLLVSESGLIINNWIRLRALETQKVDLTEYDIEINDLKTKKQDTLVSGENIKTVNGQSIVGSGNINIEAGFPEEERATISNLIELLEYTTMIAEKKDFNNLPLLCGQPMILFGAGTPQEAVVPDNWIQYDIETGEGYNWNGLPSALGQRYINTSASSGGNYIAVRSGAYDLRWLNI